MLGLIIDFSDDHLDSGTPKAPGIEQVAKFEESFWVSFEFEGLLTLCDNREQNAADLMYSLVI